MSAEEAGELPEGWVLCESKSLPGRKYYFDRRTGSSLWTKPPPPPAPEPDKESKCSKKRKHKKAKDDVSPSHSRSSSPNRRNDCEQRVSLKRKSDSLYKDDSPVKKTRPEPSRNESHYPETPRISVNVNPHSSNARGDSSRCDQRQKPTSTHTSTSTPNDGSPSKRTCQRKRKYSDDRSDFDRSSPRYPGTTRTETPKSHNYDHRSGSFSKNLASKRMSEIRSNLNKDVDRNEKSPSSFSDTPKSQHYDGQSKKHEFVSPKMDHRYSPVDRTDRPQSKGQRPNDPYFQKANIPKNRDLQSPSNDLAHTTSSAGDNVEIASSSSQFFPAYKMIYSLKAKLGEERNIEKPIDTFSSIEEGINTPAVKYSSSNHPATPPQFVEASKLVSSMKFKLNENISDCERKPKFASANDRLSAFRTSLTHDNDQQRLMSPHTQTLTHKPVLIENRTTNLLANPVVNEHLPARTQVPVAYNKDAMEVEYSRENSDAVAKDNLILVVDTNIFIHDIQFLKTVLESHIKGFKEKPTLVVPWQVMNELDRLKDNNNGNKLICTKAKAAIDYLYQALPTNHRIKGQTLRDAGSHIYPCDLPDDEILNCCLQQSQHGNAVMLLSNDKNLCTRATINSVRALGPTELKELLRAETEHTNRDSDLKADLKHCEDCLYQLLANILENEMREKYNNLWQHVLFKAPPWCLLDVLQCLLKHWIAVFSEVMPRIEPLIHQLKVQLTRIYDKGPHNLLQSDVVSFKQLSVEMASKCIIIPEYMELAKLTVERINNNYGSNDVRSPPTERDGEKVVTDTFENVWTVFSSYCAKLATSLGVHHQLEDRIPNGESLDSLRNKWPVFSNQIQSLTYAIKKTLIANENSEEFQSLLAALADSQAIIGANRNAIDNSSLRIFCLNNRSMLQEALVKFTQLTELLEHCRCNISNN